MKCTSYSGIWYIGHTNCCIHLSATNWTFCAPYISEQDGIKRQDQLGKEKEKAFYNTCENPRAEDNQEGSVP